MDKDIILNEIRRTADPDTGRPLGVRRFECETGIKEYHWQKHWARFSDAQREAGFTPNGKTLPYEKDDVLRKLADLTRNLGRVPTDGDLRLTTARQSDFPEPSTIRRKTGTKGEMVRSIIEYCQRQKSYEDVVKICEEIEISVEVRQKAVASANGSVDGFVYLLKSGRYYKIGKTNSVGRREREIALQMPESIKLIHEIKTDDPVGIEAYWHNRFDAKRKNGEWFDLAPEDVSAFRRRRFM